MLYISTPYKSTPTSNEKKQHKHLLFRKGTRTFAAEIKKQHRGVEQLVARWAHNPKVVSSSLASATKSKVSYR